MALSSSRSGFHPVGYLASPLDWPFVVDDNAYVTGQSISDFFSLTLR